LNSGRKKGNIEKRVFSRMSAKDGMYYVQRDIKPCAIPESLWRAELLLFQSIKLHITQQ
jgi:hypothetical protein